MYRFGFGAKWGLSQGWESRLARLFDLQHGSANKQSLW